MTDRENRSLGALVGMFVGDAFGAQTEFTKEQQIRRVHPAGFSEMDSRNRFIGEAGMITDDSEMAIMLAKSMGALRRVDGEDIKKHYLRWVDTGPSDIGITIFGALRDGVMNPQSQANGALMRVAPIGVAGAWLADETVIAYSDIDCALTHIQPSCRDANRLWALGIAKAIREGLSGAQVYEYLRTIASTLSEESLLLEVIEKAEHEGPLSCDGPDQGWVIIAFHLALHTLLHAPSFEEGIIDVTMRAGDADTNAAIYGALAGAVAGVDAIPERWIRALRPTRALKKLLGPKADNLYSLAQSLVTNLSAW